CGPPRSYALEAAIAAVHADAARAEQTDWPQIAALYERLEALHPPPVVALNRAVAVAMADPPAARPAPLHTPPGPPPHPHPPRRRPVHAARPALPGRLGPLDEAAAAYRSALERTENEAERRFLTRRLAEVTP